MPYYTLVTASTGKHLHALAADRVDALRNFSKELGQTLSLEETVDTTDSYLMDEWWNNPHWTNPKIPVYAMRVSNSI